MFCENHFGLAGTVFGVLCFAPARAFNKKLSTSRDFKLCAPSPARQVLPAADQPGPDQHAARGADGEQEGVPEASQPGRGHHDLVWPEGGRVHTRLRLKICLLRPQDSHALSLSTFVDMKNQLRDVREGLCMLFRLWMQKFYPAFQFREISCISPPLHHISLRLVCVPPKRLESFLHDGPNMCFPFHF